MDYSCSYFGDAEVLKFWEDEFPDILPFIKERFFDEKQFDFSVASTELIVVTNPNLLTAVKKRAMVMSQYIELLLAQSLIMPNKLRIDFSTLCQLDCKTCYMRLSDNGTMGYGYLRFFDFKALIDGNPYIKEIETSNSGELFLNPDLIKIMEYAHQKNVLLTAYNGVNMNTASDEQLEAMVKYGFKGLVVSIDGATQNTYVQYRRNGNFKTVINNLKKLLRYKKEYDSALPVIRWQYIIMRHNEMEIPLAKSIAHDLGIPIEFKLTWDKDYFPENIELLKRETGFAVFSRADNKMRQPYFGHLKCIQAFLSPQINWDGRLLGCCSLYKTDYGVNVFEVGLQNALRSKKFIAAKKYLLYGECDNAQAFPCAGCGTARKIKLNNVGLHPIQTMYGSGEAPKFLDYIPYS